jgi:hypothetical protein
VSHLRGGGESASGGEEQREVAIKVHNKESLCKRLEC